MAGDSTTPPLYDALAMSPMLTESLVKKHERLSLLMEYGLVIAASDSVRIEDVVAGTPLVAQPPSVMFRNRPGLVPTPSRKPAWAAFRSSPVLVSTQLVPSVGHSLRDGARVALVHSGGLVPVTGSAG